MKSRNHLQKKEKIKKPKWLGSETFLPFLQVTLSLCNYLVWCSRFIDPLDHYCFLLLLRGWCDTWGSQPGHWRSMQPGPTHRGDENRSPQRQSSQWRLLSPSPWHRNCSSWVTAWRMSNSLVCRSTFQIFFLLSTNHIHRCAHKYTHGHAHTCAHPTLTRAHTPLCFGEQRTSLHFVWCQSEREIKAAILCIRKPHPPNSCLSA